MIVTAMVLVALAGAGFFVRIAAGPSLADRVVAVDGLVVTIVAAIVLNAIRTRSAAFLDVTVVVAFVGFVGTSASARFIERRSR